MPNGPLTQPPPDGDLLGIRLGNYLVRQIVGRGGMATVYCASDLLLGRQVALKVFSRRMMASDRVVHASFLRDARAGSRINHPNVIKVFNVGVSGDHHFVAMEYMSGGSLRERVQRGGPIPPEEALGYAIQAAMGVAAAHAERIIHRDLKPGNLLINRRGELKVVDFGLAHGVQKEVDGIPERTGTPAYMAPELWDGGPASVQSDLYAIGATIFQLVSGELPFFADSLTEISRLHHQSEIPRVNERQPDLPAELPGILQRCMAKRPEQRYRDCEELLADLRNAHRAALLQAAEKARKGLNTRNHATSSRVMVIVPGVGPVAVESLHEVRPSMDRPTSFAAPIENPLPENLGGGLPGSDSGILSVEEFNASGSMETLKATDRPSSSGDHSAPPPPSSLAPAARLVADQPDPQGLAEEPHPAKVQEGPASAWILTAGLLLLIGILAGLILIR